METNVPGGMGDSGGGAYLPSSWTGSEAPDDYTGHSLHLPSADLTIPSETRSGRITILRKNKDPIFIELSDGTKLYFTYDEFKRIKPREPALGRVMNIAFQRHPKTPIEQVSQISNISCH